MEKHMRLEALFRAMELLVAARHAGHMVHAELNRVIDAVMKELDLHHDK